MDEPRAPGAVSADGLADAHTVAILVVLIGVPLGLVLAFFPSSGEKPVLVLAGLAVIEVVMAVALFRLARALGERGAILWALTPLVSVMLGAIGFAFLNGRARKRLRAEGLDVGPLGARPRERGGKPKV